MLPVMKKRDARSLDHSTLEEMRRLAVQRVVSGESRRSVAESLFVHPNTVWKWVTTFHAEGEEGLASTKAPGPGTKLTPKQIERLCRIIIGKTPKQMNFGPCLWTVPVITDMVAKLFGAVLHPTTVSRLLNRIGITPQKPVRRAFQRDEIEVAHWMRVEFPTIVRRAKRRQATLLFLDETGLHEVGPLGTTWGVRGKTPVVRVSGTRRRINVISAISPRGRLWFRCYSGTLTAAKFEEFLRDLLHDVRGEILLVLDRHPAHKAGSVRRFVAANTKRLETHFLPGYSPDLNPDEHVWSALKGYFRRDPLDADENIHAAVDGAMKAIAQRPSAVRAFFKHPEVAYVKEALKW